VLSAADSDVKEQLKKNVAEAVALGAFGAPFIVVDDQVYFGSDRLEQMAFTHDLPWHGPAPRAAKL
jgi:2-hydroxychromene-2-carboxylate isomerase